MSILPSLPHRHPTRVDPSWLIDTRSQADGPTLGPFPNVYARSRGERGYTRGGRSSRDLSTGLTYELFRRSFDIVFSGFALVVFSWLLVGVGLLIVLEDRGPVFYFQMRTGKAGRPFRFFKLRTMVRDADALKARLAQQNEASGPIFKIRHDPRVTRTGYWLRRYSIDELPQFLNVLRGEMSIVGPRPLPMNEAARCNPAQQQRHLVKPGLLCFREVAGRSRLSFDEWMDLDLKYLRDRSLKTDFAILLRAVPAILRGDGAY